MARPKIDEADSIVETWEITFPGSVWVFQYDRREDRYNKTHVGGRTGSKRLHITRDDRKFNQEQIPDENRDLDPFTNGCLRLIEAGTRDENLDVRFHLSHEELLATFQERDPEAFEAKVRAIDSELILRRLREASETDGTVAQRQVLVDLLSERYPVGGTQKTIKEMLDAGERLNVARL